MAVKSLFGTIGAGVFLLLLVGCLQPHPVSYVPSERVLQEVTPEMARKKLVEYANALHIIPGYLREVRSDGFLWGGPDLPLYHPEPEFVSYSSIVSVQIMFGGSEVYVYVKGRAEAYPILVAQPYLEHAKTVVDCLTILEKNAR